MYYAEKDECDTEGSVDDTEASSSGASSPPSGFSLANPQIAEKIANLVAGTGLDTGLVAAQALTSRSHSMVRPGC